MQALPERIGRYEIRGELGRGGMGLVYDAYDPRLGRAVALKVIHPDRIAENDAANFLARFEQEMKATSEALHPNLVSVFDAGSADPKGDLPSAYYVMERVVGPSLEERLQGGGKLPRAEALRIAAAVSRGLAAAHRLGLVHRDLKASNVLLPLDAEAKVSDFGLCRSRGDEVTPEDWILGSAHAIAPEQIRGAEVSAAADLFALGCLLVRMLSGREPFASATLDGHLYRVLHDAPDGLDALPADLREFARTLLSKDPNERAQDAEEVAARLESLAAAAPSEASPRSADGAPPGRPPRVREWLRRPSGIALAVAAVVAALATGLWSYNGIVHLDHQAALRWSQVENQLARQHALLPRLRDLVAEYNALEAARLTRILEGVAASAPTEPQGALRFERDTRALWLMAERIAPLQASRHYRDLAHELIGTQNRLAVERARYNAAASAYNERLEQMPWRWLGRGRPARAFYRPSDAALAQPARSTPTRSVPAGADA